MVRHGSSHGFAVLICSIAAALLVELIRDKIPRMISWLDGISEKIVSVLSIEANPNYISTLLFASILAFIWGVFFKIRTSRRT